MTKLNLYRLISLILLVVNLSLTVFLYLNRPEARGRDGRDNPERLVEALGFGAAERTAFEDSKTRHQEGMRELTEQKGDQLRAYFAALLPGSTTDSTQQALLLARIDSIEAARIQLTYQHFEEVKNLVRSENEAAFGDFVKKALDRLLITDNKRPGPPGKRRRE